MTDKLERQQPSDPYLDLIREVTGNPELSAEKLKILVDMRLLLEDREAQKLFDAAMKAAQKKVVALKWDKKGDNNLYVKYPTIEKMLRPIREEFGFTQSFDTEVSPVAGQMIFCCDVSHDGGHTKRYRLPMSIDGQGPKGGGVMTGAQAVGNGTSYAMRYLQKMIWNIPMLVDKDDNDGNIVIDTVTEEQAINLRCMCEQIDKEQERRLCEYYAQVCKRDITKLEQLPKAKYQDALKGLTKKIRDGA